MPLFTGFPKHPRWCRISEPSTARTEKIGDWKMIFILERLPCRCDVSFREGNMSPEQGPFYKGNVIESSSKHDFFRGDVSFREGKETEFC